MTTTRMSLNTVGGIFFLLSSVNLYFYTLIQKENKEANEATSFAYTQGTRKRVAQADMHDVRPDLSHAGVDSGELFFALNGQFLLRVGNFLLNGFLVPLCFFLNSRQLTFQLCQSRLVCLVLLFQTCALRPGGV